MENFKFLELFYVKKQSNPTECSFSYFVSQPYVSNFITTINNFDIKAKDVTVEVNKGNYELRNKFTILYLYDFSNDETSINFLTKYGSRIHNQSSLNVSIFTYYSLNMVSQWNNVQFKEILNQTTNLDSSKALKSINLLKELYMVQTLPALVVIKKSEDGKEEYLNISLSGLNEDKLLSTFRDIIDIINDNCEEDFQILSSKLSGSVIKKGSGIETFNTFNYINDLIKKERKIILYGYTQFDLAAELNIDVRTLRNKRSNNSFTRDECIFIGLRFGIDIDELNELLRVNDHTPLNGEGKDEICRRGLINCEDVYDVHTKLIEHGYKGILNPDKN